MIKKASFATLQYPRTALYSPHELLLLLLLGIFVFLQWAWRSFLPASVARKSFDTNTITCPPETERKRLASLQNRALLGERRSLLDLSFSLNAIQSTQWADVLTTPLGNTKLVYILFCLLPINEISVLAPSTERIESFVSLVAYEAFFFLSP